MKKIGILLAMCFVFAFTAIAQVLPKTEKTGIIQNTLWTGMGLPAGNPDNSDRATFRWAGLIDTLQGRVDVGKFTMDGMIAWGALTNWDSQHVEHFGVSNTDLQQFRFMNENRTNDSYYINFAWHPFEGFDVGVGTKLNWDVGPAPSLEDDPWRVSAHVEQGDLGVWNNYSGWGGYGGNAPTARAVSGYLNYTTTYADKAIGVRYRYKDIVEVGLAIPDGVKDDNFLMNFGLSVHPIDLLTVAVTYTDAFIDNGNLYAGLTLDFSSLMKADFFINAYFAFNGLFLDHNDANRIWGLGAQIYFKFPTIPLSLMPEVGFNWYTNENYTMAWYTGIRVQFDITKKFNVAAWTSFAWGARDRRWKDYNATEEWTGGFVWNIRPEVTFNFNDRHSISAAVEYERIDYPDKSDEDKFLIGFFYTYKTF